MGRGQGDHVGTGSPISFMCARLRRDVWWEDRSDYVRSLHKVRRTGRTRPRPHTGVIGLRNMATSHEYRCSCGYLGRTTHRDILRYPLGCPDNGTCHHGLICMAEQRCFRTVCCEPLSGVFPNDEWPKAYR